MLYLLIFWDIFLIQAPVTRRVLRNHWKYVRDQEKQNKWPWQDNKIIIRRPEKSMTS